MASDRAERQKRRVERFRRGKIHPGPMRLAFTRFASWASDWLGSHWAFAIAVLIVVGWFVSGVMSNFDQGSLLLINTVTTIITFLMVFVIQNTQTRDSKAIHLKLDELIRSDPQARNEFMESEEEDLDEILREKEIVERADPAPPAEREGERRNGNGHRHEEPKAS